MVYSFFLLFFGNMYIKRLDEQGRRVLCIDLSCYKRYDELHKATSSKKKKNGGGRDAATTTTTTTKLVETDYLRLLYFVCHACLFDNNAIDRGVVVIVSLNHIGPLEFRRAFPTKVREQISEITNGISCFRMKECYLLRAPWWMKGLMVSKNYYFIYIYISNNHLFYST